MSDPIARQAAIDHWRAIIDATDENDRYNMGFADGLEFCISDLSTMPSAQPEIIRCAECKWFQCNMRMDGYLPKGVDEFECRHWCGSCDPVDFCSHAERREE